MTTDSLQWQRPSEVNTDECEAVEIADTEEGVLLRIGSGHRNPHLPVGVG
jgi:hypothetical protein